MIIQKSNFGSEKRIRSGIHEGRYCYGDHMHQFCELVWVLEGEIEMTVAGKREIARKGDMTVITPYLVHSFYTAEYSKILIAVISDSFIVSSIRKEELFSDFERSTFTLSKELSDLLYAKDFAGLCLSQLGVRYDNNYLHNVESLIHLIFAEYFNTVPTVTPNSSKTTLSKILIYLSEHFTEPLTLRSVGLALGYSPKYVSNCISRLGGWSFRRLLNSLRVDHAKFLLVSDPHLTVVDVALRCGFSNEQSFHRAFLENVGTTPAKYRKEKSSAK